MQSKARNNAAAAIHVGDAPLGELDAAAARSHVQPDGDAVDIERIETELHTVANYLRLLSEATGNGGPDASELISVTGAAFFDVMGDLAKRCDRLCLNLVDAAQAVPQVS